MKAGTLVLMLMMAMEVAGQTNGCTAEDTQKQCFAKIISQWKADATPVQAAMETANTGVSGLLSSSQSTTQDFLSQLIAAFAVPMNGNGSRPVSIDFKLLSDIKLPSPIESSGDLKLQVEFAKPEMSGPLKQRLGSNTAALTEIKDSLSEFDDLTVSASLGLASRRFGRDVKYHEESYRDRLTKRLAALSLANEPGLTGPIGSANLATVEARARTAVETEASQFAEYYAALLNNQPQFHGTVSYRARKDVAGPDERMARITYEQGFTDLNQLYANKPVDTKDALQENRLAVSIEYRTANGFTVALPKHQVGFSASPARTVTYSLAYGRNRMMSNKGRLDVAVDYEDSTGSTITDANPASVGAVTIFGPVRDRFVASATYTYQMNGQMAMPLTLTYANHAAFLGDVDRKLNAHFGISFKMPPRPAAATP